MDEISSYIIRGNERKLYLGWAILIFLLKASLQTEMLTANTNEDLLLDFLVIYNNMGGKI